jgi:ABC-type transport system substrate-binding protein
MFHARTSTARALKSAIAGWLLAIGMGAPPFVHAAEGDRLYEQEPYDQIELEDGTIVKVQPIPTEQPGPIEPPKRKSQKLMVETIEPPGKYEVAWNEIARVRRFPELLIEEADRLVADGKLDLAYDYLDHLQQTYPAWPGLDSHVNRFLMADAKASHSKGNDAYALAVLGELQARNPKFKGLADAVGEVVAPLVQAEIDNRDYRAARRLLANLSKTYPDHPVCLRLQKQLSDTAGGLVATAEEHRANGRLPEAYEVGALAVNVWPVHEGARKLMIDLQREYPRVIVGVSQPAGGSRGDRLDDWPGRRARRLLQRTLFEFTGYGPQGGEYTCPFGKATKLELDTQLLLELNRKVEWSSGAPLTGYDVAESLLALADSTRGGFQADWADLLRATAVNEVFEVEVDLRRAHVRPEALLRVELMTWDRTAAASGAAPSLGPYVRAESSAGEEKYVAHERYFARGPGQPREIIERHFTDPRQALTALRRGQVAILDRINPWELKLLRDDDQIVIERYAVPTLHCLLPNMGRPFTAHRAFRRGLVYGINRELILNQQLFQGTPVPGCRIVSGPFVAGESADDTQGYAYNDELPPRPYQPRLAMTLFNLALHDVAEQAKARNEEVKTIPDLVLAHPPHELARVACRAIQRHLKAIELNVTLVELPHDPSAPQPDYDLRYAELALWEPVTDARRLLGPNGMVGGCSAYLEQALRQLDEVGGWKAARDRLLEVHRVAFQDTAVIPLWQITDHVAYNRNIGGIGQRPVSLYQNIEKWRIEPWFLAETE